WNDCPETRCIDDGCDIVKGPNIIWITVQQHDWQGINRTAVLISNVQNRGSNLGQMSQALPPWPAFNEIAPQRYDEFVMSATGHFRPTSEAFAYRPLPLRPNSGHSASWRVYEYTPLARAFSSCLDLRLGPLHVMPGTRPTSPAMTYQRINSGGNSFG